MSASLLLAFKVVYGFVAAFSLAALAGMVWNIEADPQTSP